MKPRLARALIVLTVFGLLVVLAATDRYVTDLGRAPDPPPRASEFQSQGAAPPAAQAGSPAGALLVLAAALSALAPVLRAYHRTMPPSPSAASTLAAGERRPRWVTWAMAAGAAALLLIALLQPLAGAVPPR